MLASWLGISRNTVNLAYQELAADGYISSRPRAGAFVNPEMQELLATRSPSSSGNQRQQPDWSELTNAPDTLGSIDKNLPPNWFEFPYPFIGGQVAPDAFPSRAWLRALRKALDPEHFWFSLEDARSWDDPLLVQQLCAEILPTRGITASPDEILITGGSQQAIYLLAKALVKPGMPVVVEDPGYPDAYVILRNAGAKVLAVPTDTHGIRMLDQVGEAKLIMVTPSHNFPTGATLSAARRRRLLQTARDSNSIVIEDDYDSELRYHGKPSPALRAIDNDQRVVYLGSFSKFLAPGLRLGFVVASPELIAHMRTERRLMTRHPPGHMQRAMALLIQSGDYTSSLRRHRSTLKSKWELMVRALRTHTQWRVHVSTGGTTVWVAAPKAVDTVKLAEAATAAGVLFEPGHIYFRRSPCPKNYLRLGFAAVRDDRIEPGIRILAKLASNAAQS